MTEAPPPSIPPRSRPPAPGTAARPVRPVAGHPDAVTADPSGRDLRVADHEGVVPQPPSVPGPAEPPRAPGTAKVPRRTATSARKSTAPAATGAPVAPGVPSATDGLGSAALAAALTPPVTAPRATPPGPARSGPAQAPAASTRAPSASAAPPSGAVPIAAPPIDQGAGPASSTTSASSSIAPAPDGASSLSPVDDDEAEAPSALSVAVDQTTAWVRKAATSTGATLSAAYASLTRPRPKESEMTANPVAPSSAATRSVPPPLATEPGTVGIGAPRPMTGRIPTVSAGPRRVRLAVSRIDPWSVMKLAFLLSFAMGIMGVIAVMVVWATLNGLHVFTTINSLIGQIVGAESNINVLDYVQFSKVVSAATLISVVDVFLLTALATIGAFLYNIVAALVGGVHVTMTDE